MMRRVPERLSTVQRSWRRLLENVIGSLPEDFALAEVMSFKPLFERAYPKNRFVEEKLRQTLQVLRDEGIITFEGRGKYRRILPRANPSVRIDFSVAAHLVSSAQIARVAIEAWAQLNVCCALCGGGRLFALPPNTPVIDMQCTCCQRGYQIKAKNGFFEGKLMGAAYGPLARSLKAGTVPDFLLIEYSRSRALVLTADILEGAQISSARVSARAPLGPSARRSGWIGSVIDISDLPLRSVVGPAFVSGPKSLQREETQNASCRRDRFEDEFE
ncbi:MAG: hypothetical protein GIW94_12295 [Candidatus Eremiobacteraeota bacterium]|nr:hypothetical protein [Candidatus Eremiobacteraeota bacterium]MBC5825151.1 hypothetical protein [Candidatus Eremiobacteraeota bacterium]